MSTQWKPVEEVTEADLQQLIADSVRESQTLEYKRESYGRNDEQVREMLRDISSMANAFGGDLLLGVEEDDQGIAVSLPGLANAEAEAQRIVSSCLSNVHERISGLVARPIRLRNGLHVIAVRTPRSLRAPHMVTFRGMNQFWARHDRQKSPMSIDEIREACLKAEGLMEKLERFLERRRREVLEEIGAASYYVVSVTPVFVSAEAVNIRDPRIRHLLANPPHQRPGGWTISFGSHAAPCPTLHGLTVEIPNAKAIEVFRNGHIELRVGIKGSFCPDHATIEGQEYPLLRAHPLIEYPVSLLRLSKVVYAHLGILDPVVISLALYNIGGFALVRRAEEGSWMTPVSGHGPTVWKKKHLEIPPRQIASLDQPDRVAEEFADRIWQAFGFDEAPLFDAEGNFRPDSSQIV